MTRLLAGLSHLGVAVVGGVVAIAATVVHRVGVPAFGLVLPVGLVLAVLTTFAVGWSLRLIPVPSRLVTSYAAGWVLTLVVVLRGRPEGDYIVAGDGVGYTLVLTGVVLLGYGVFSAGRVADSSSDRDAA